MMAHNIKDDEDAEEEIELQIDEETKGIIEMAYDMRRMKSIMMSRELCKDIIKAANRLKTLFNKLSRVR
jgi:HEPN domain-containing protein